MGDNSHTAYHQRLFDSAVLLDEAARTMTTFMRPVPPTDMQLVLHKGGWQVSVSPTLVESNLTVAGP